MKLPTRAYEYGEKIAPGVSCQTAVWGYSLTGMFEHIVKSGYAPAAWFVDGTEAPASGGRVRRTKKLTVEGREIDTTKDRSGYSRVRVHWGDKKPAWVERSAKSDDAESDQSEETTEQPKFAYPKKISYHEGNERYPATRLPFYRDGENCGHYWALPASSWKSDRRVGRLMGMAYLKHLAETKDETPVLQYVASAIKDRIIATNSKDEKGILHEQGIGFFLEVCRCLRRAMTENKKLAAEFREIRESWIVSKANQALAGKWVDLSD